MTGMYQSDLSETAELKKLWLECFDELPEAYDLFAERLKNIMSVYCAGTDRELAAAVYLINCSLNGRPAHYLCGAATKRQLRGRGIMTELIKYALGAEKASGCSFSLLYPESNGLYGFYERLGYLPLCSAQRICLTRENAEKAARGFYENSERNQPKHAEYEKLQQRCFGSDFLLQSDEFINFAREYYSLYGLNIIDKPDCFAVLESRGNQTRVIYAAYADFSSLCGYLLGAADSMSYIITDKARNASRSEVCGMICSLDGSKLPESTYIGITLS